jgi:hypothetical protein
MKNLFRRFLALFKSAIFYQVKSENQTHWITRDEWISNQRIIPFAVPMTCGRKRRNPFMENNNQTPNQPEFYRFKVFQGNRNPQGKIERTKTVGMSYHASGQENYTLRLWTFTQERFYLLPDQKKPGRYFVMTRELNKKPNPKSKYYWNIVGSGQVDSANGVIEIELDLFSKTVFMNIFPEAQVHSVSFADFEEEPFAA